MVDWDGGQKEERGLLMGTPLNCEVVAWEAFNDGTEAYAIITAEMRVKATWNDTMETPRLEHRLLFSGRPRSGRRSCSVN